MLALGEMKAKSGGEGLVDDNGECFELDNGIPIYTEKDWGTIKVSVMSASCSVDHMWDCFVEYKQRELQATAVSTCFFARPLVHNWWWLSVAD
jgi:hypothetical protein